MIKRQISVIIITKNRSSLLEKCLSSLLLQIFYKDEIVLINNASTDDTYRVYTKFSKKLPIVYVYSSLEGYSLLYNLGIKNSTKSNIYFLDDDCFVPKNWRISLDKSLSKNKGNVIQGKTISTPVGNIYAEIMGDHYRNWIESHKVTSSQLDTFDNKNLLIPRNILYVNNKLDGYSPSILIGSEDIELGRRFYIKGVKIIFDKSIVVFHRERSSFVEMVKQHYRIASSEKIVYSITNNYSALQMFPRRKTLLNIRSFFRRELKYLSKGKIVSAVVCFCVYVVLFIIRIYVYTKK